MMNISKTCVDYDSLVKRIYRKITQMYIEKNIKIENKYKIYLR